MKSQEKKKKNFDELNKNDFLACLNLHLGPEAVCDIRTGGIMADHRMANTSFPENSTSLKPKRKY